MSVYCESGLFVEMAVYIVLGGYLRILGAPSVESCFTLSISVSYHIFVCGRYHKFRLSWMLLLDLDSYRHRPLL